MKRLVVLAADVLLALLLPAILVARLLAQASLRMLGGGRISIWTGAPIICMAKNCKAERQLGFRSWSVVRRAYYITSEFDFDLSRVSRDSRALSLLSAYVALILIAVLAAQVHAYADGGIMPSRRRRHFNPLELFIYRLLGIRLLIWTYGADVRTRDATLALGEPNCCTDCVQVGQACICDAESARENFNRVKLAATAVFSMGDMIEYTPGSRNDLFFWPVDLASQERRRYQPVFPPDDSEAPLRVVHAPNHRQFKGTGYLEHAIEALRREGLAIELVLIEKVPNERALEIYRSADIIFDQCLIGFHGYFALEAMALGKPVMCFIRKPDQYLLHAGECPMISTHVETLKEDLRRLYDRRRDLADIGRRGRQYIEQHFSLEAFAARLGCAYRDLDIHV